jgi:hypothetical protein
MKKIKKICIKKKTFIKEIHYQIKLKCITVEMSIHCLICENITLKVTSVIIIRVLESI